MSKKICYSVFIEDKPYLLWQLELFLYSLTKRAKIEDKDIFLFWASPDFYKQEHHKDPENPEQEPWMPSPWLRGIMQAYPRMHHRYCQNFGRQNRYFRFMGKGNWGGRNYPGLNKWSAWIEWQNAGVFDEWDEVWILEQDLWFSDELPKVPEGNVVSYNWIPNKKIAFERKSNKDDKDEWQTLRGFKSNSFRGQDLEQIMKVTGMNKPKIDKWKQGAVLFKFRTKDLQPKLLNDIMNYNYLLLHLMEIKHPLGARHETDMIAPSLALANNNIEIESLKDATLRTDTWTHNEEIPKGTIVHYGWDFEKYPHLGVEFGKHKFGELAPWQGGLQNLKDQREKAKFEWVKNYFTDMINIHYDFPNVLRECRKTAHQMRV
tara:strand:+ start:3948 stop:5072 length:1125 start_codon:yes stop_codon:yes gene_type:complete